MARKSSIKTLPKPILAEVNRLLTEEQATIDEVVAHLAQLGHPRKRSAVGVYRQEVSKVAEKMRRSREMADALVREIGPGVVEGKTGRLLVEILQSIAFDFLLKRAGAEGGEASEELDSQDFFFLGKALKEMASALKIDTDRELNIRKDVAKQAATAAEKAVKQAGKDHGFVLPPEALQAIREQVYGIVETK